MRLFSIFIILLFVQGIVFSQKHNLKHFSIDEGLPQASVYCVYQDLQGYIWFGTQGGVAKFDGLEFENFTQKDGLAENHITSIFQDSLGDFWFGHRYEGISIMKGSKIISLKGNLPEMTEQVSCFSQAGKYILAGTRGNGIFAIEIASISEPEIKYTHINNDFGLESESIFDFHVNINGDIWIATSKGIYSIDARLNKKSLKKLSSVDNVFSTAIYDIEKAKDNSLWISSSEGIYHVSQPLENHFSIVYETYSDKTITGGYRKIAIDKYGSVWFTTQSGVGKIEKNNIRFFKEENGLTDFEITSIKNDREGNIWFGMMGDGIYQYLGEAFINWDVENGLSYKVVQAILIDNKNNAWIGTEKGISIVSQNETVKSLFEKDGLTDNNIQALFQDSRNLIWIGTANGISVFDPSNEKIIKITKLQGLAANLSLTINEDKNGHIWTGSLGEGTSQIIMNGKKIVKVVNYYKQQGFASNAIWKIFKDSKGNLWFGTNDAGLIKYDGESFTTINSDDGLPNQRPGSITEDKQGNLWIGSIGGGVIKFNPLSNTFTSYTTQNGISSDNPYLVISDNENNIWVGTNYGIDRIDSNGKIKHFGKNEGFHGVETNQNAVALDGEGNIWFGTIKGVVKCNPSLLKENKEAPLIHIKKVRIFLKEEKLPAGNKFTYNKNHLTFDFVGISFANAEKVQYRYKLQGFDQEWQPLTSARFATYSNLEAGNYTFLVECKNNDGVWSNSPSTFNFIIAPPFWKTSWFYILITIIFIGIAYGFVLTRTHKLKQTKNKLEELVSFRTRELKQEKEKVEKVNKEVVIQKNIIELKNKDITDSINYAKRIQEAILPSLNVIEKGFKGLFFYYKPKDIVSGDFYWFSENGNSKTIAIADCTGHGVPGALMSIIGNNVLNEVISEKTVSSTGLALELLDGKIRHILKQNSNLNHTSEGMDIALINIDLAKMELCFSGAYRPLVLIREGNLVEYKGDKIAIGGYHENKKQFTDHVIKLEKNDIFYLFSDGYADQFGGTTGKKMMTNNFKKLLLQIHQFPLKEQKEKLADFFKQWKGDLEQVDDVLVAGFKV